MGEECREGTKYKEKMSFSTFQSDAICDSESSLLCVRYHPELKLVACSSECGSVFVLNSRCVLEFKVKLSDSDVTSLAFGSENNLFASSEQYVYEIDLKSQSKTNRVWQIGREEINFISLNKSGTKLAAADDDGRIRVVPVGKGQKGGVKAFRAKHENLVSHVEWVNDAVLISCSADQSAKSWHSRDQKCIKTLDVSEFKNQCRDNTKVNVSPPLLHTLALLEPHFVVFGGENGNIMINKLDNGRLSTSKLATKVYSGAHQFGIGSLVARGTNDGEWEMVSGGNDSFVKVWSIGQGQMGADLKLIHSINVNVKGQWFMLVGSFSDHLIHREQIQFFDF